METISALAPRYVREFVDAARRSVNEVLGRFRNNPDWEGELGGYFCAADAKTGLPLAVVLIGTVPVEKAEMYLLFCQEKARRLAAHPDHQTSFESRNPAVDQWGGAVRGGEFIFSFSGLPELADEATMMGVAYLCSHRTCSTAEHLHAIAVRNNNMEYWGPLALVLL